MKHFINIFYFTKQNRTGKPSIHSFKKSTKAFFSYISFGINLKYDEKSCIAPWNPPLFDGISLVLYKYFFSDLMPGNTMAYEISSCFINKR